jgi:hypothetical protein
MRFGWVQILLSGVAMALVGALLWPAPAMAAEVSSPYTFDDPRGDQIGNLQPDIDLVGGTVRNAQGWMRITYRVRGTPPGYWPAAVIDSRRTGPGQDLYLQFQGTRAWLTRADHSALPPNPPPLCQAAAVRVGAHGISASFNKRCHPGAATLLTHTQVRVRIVVVGCGDMGCGIYDVAPDRGFTPWIRVGG